MGGGQSSQCDFGTFGTGKGIPVEYNGFKINLGGSDICTNTLAECANQCQAMGCGSSGEQFGDCCKLCEKSCCQPGPAYKPDSTVCKQLSYDARVQLPDDYCTNPASRKKYDDECPTGCLSFAETPGFSPKRQDVKHAVDWFCEFKFLLLLIIFLLALFLLDF